MSSTSRAFDLAQETKTGSNGSTTAVVFLLAFLGSSPDFISSSVAAAPTAVKSCPLPGPNSVSEQTSSSARAIARLEAFSNYQDDWDDQGAKAPREDAIDAALEFISYLQPWHPVPFATIDRDGNSVIELNDPSTNYFGSITFTSKLDVELYIHRGDRPSKFFEGDLNTTEARQFLRTEMQIFLP